MSQRDEAELVTEILARYDRDGNLRRMIRGFEGIASSPLGRLILDHTNLKLDGANELLTQTRHLLMSAARSVLLFAPYGRHRPSSGHDRPNGVRLKRRDSTRRRLECRSMEPPVL